MSRLLDIQEQLKDTTAAIAQFEKAYATAPQSGSIAAMLKSFEKQKHQLEHEFLSAARQLGTDVCSYRFFSDFVRPTVTPLCSSLVDFQSLYSVIYDAVKSGPKKRFRKLTPDVLDESSFFFGYTFSGSVGVVLTFDNDKVRLFETALDESMRSVFELAQARTSEEIVSRGKKVGVPAIRALHRWVVSHVESSLGAEIEWRRGHETLDKILLQVADLRELLAAIDSTTEIIEDEVELTALLAGADVARRTFHLEVENLPDIRGVFSQFIPANRTFEVGRQHKVTLRKKVKVYYSVDKEEDVSYQLVTATPV